LVEIRPHVGRPLYTSTRYNILFVCRSAHIEVIYPINLVSMLRNDPVISTPFAFALRTGSKLWNHKMSLFCPKNCQTAMHAHSRQCVEGYSRRKRQMTAYSHCQQATCYKLRCVREMHDLDTLNHSSPSEPQSNHVSSVLRPLLHSMFIQYHSQTAKNASACTQTKPSSIPTLTFSQGLNYRDA
jgi:hypothetical protein